MLEVIDLRSDTVTTPTDAMREAMARAAVGDDWYGEDPTVNHLQEEVAGRLGKEAALFVPSGTMANQVALRVHCAHGDDVLMGEEAHMQWHENGAAGALAGVQITVVGRGGLFSAEEVEEAVKPQNGLYPPSRLLCVEDTHNRGGGRCWPLDQLQAVCAAARRHQLGLHLDGARLWNAAAAARLDPAVLAAPFDTVSVCLSKGLGAPVGSLLCGERERVRRARRYRQQYGGGLRQAGVLAAAGLYALAHHLPRLIDDHHNARLLSEKLAQVPGLRVLTPVETNIVIFDVAALAREPAQGGAALLAERLRARGVRVNAFARRRLRAVTHLQVDAAACARAAELIGAEWAALQAELC